MKNTSTIPNLLVDHSFPVEVESLVDAVGFARQRLEAIADQMLAGTRDGGLAGGRELKRALVGVFADVDAAIVALPHIEEPVDSKSGTDLVGDLDAELKEHGYDEAGRLRRLTRQIAALFSTEPVRWQRFNPNSGWIECNEEDLDHYRNVGQPVRALYVGPADDLAVEVARLAERQACAEILARNADAISDPYGKVLLKTYARAILVRKADT